VFTIAVVFIVVHVGWLLWRRMRGNSDGTWHVSSRRGGVAPLRPAVCIRVTLLYRQFSYKLFPNPHKPKRDIETFALSKRRPNERP